MATAEELQDAVDELERLSSKVAELNLPTWKAIARAGTMLGDSVAAHHRFASALEQLSEQVGELRDRHNQAADVIAQQAERVDARRLLHQGFEERFAVLAAAAQETNELVTSLPAAGEGEDPAAHVAAVATQLGAIGERLSRAAEEAQVLADDAAEAGFTELRQQADQVRSQLISMMRHVASAAPDA